MGHPIPLYILAGGQSRRFGTDKARAVLHGRSLLQRIAAELLPTATSVWAVADQPDKYADLGVATIADITPHRGPVNGLVTALEHRLSETGAGWIVLAPCDLTEPAPHWVRPLLDATDTSASGTAAAYIGPDGRWQPLPCVVHTDVLDAARRASAEGRLSLWRLLQAEGATPVALPPGRSAVPSANTPQELSGWCGEPYS